jgi:undecaprenyl-diphosphatase
MAAVLGVVEGLTEFLPVSSTGHLILVGHALGLADDAAKDFEVVIQFGAMIAVFVHYRTLLAARIRGLLARDPTSNRLLISLIAAFMPAAILGLLFRKAIKKHLFGPIPVAAALIVGGIAMIVIERALAKKPPTHTKLEEVSPRDGLFVGMAQALSLFPGMSRAMTTIVGGRIRGLDAKTAAEFSFLLAIPVLGAASALDLLKGGKALVATPEARLALAVGFVTSFLVAWAAIATFLAFLRRRGLEIFGWYRIVLGVVVLVLLRH